MNILQHTRIWLLANDIILQQGQVCQIIDQGYWKIGDGVTPFSGLQLMGLTPANGWFSFFYPIQNQGSTMSTIYPPILWGGAFIQESDWAEFKFRILPTNNSNAKTVKVNFANNTLLTITVPINSAVPIIITGMIKCTGFTNGNAQYEIGYKSTGVAEVITIGTLTGLNWKGDNNLVLEAQGVVTNDIIGQGGEAKIFIVPRI